MISFLDMPYHGLSWPRQPPCPRPFMNHSGASRRGNAEARWQTLWMFENRNHTSRRRSPPGRRIAPPDDRLQRAIQYSEASIMESKGHGLLDTSLARGMTALAG